MLEQSGTLGSESFPPGGNKIPTPRQKKKLIPIPSQKNKIDSDLIKMHCYGLIIALCSGMGATNFIFLGPQINDYK